MGYEPHNPRARFCWRRLTVTLRRAMSGSYAKRELYYIPAVDPATGAASVTGAKTQRFKTTIRSFPIAADESGVAIVFGKYWPTDEHGNAVVLPVKEDATASAAAAAAPV